MIRHKLFKQKDGFTIKYLDDDIEDIIVFKCFYKKGKLIDYLENYKLNTSGVLNKIFYI